MAMNGNLVQAEMLHRKALEIFEKTFGDSDPQVTNMTILHFDWYISYQNGDLRHI